VIRDADDDVDRLDARCVLMLEVTCHTLRSDPELRLCEGLRLIEAARTAVSRIAPAALTNFDHSLLPRMRVVGSVSTLSAERFGVSDLPNLPVN
jgi:hypothetical protein